jgi:hypothetical protein
MTMKSLQTTTIMGTVTTGGTSQKIAERNPKRDLLMLQNADAADVLYFNFGDEAVAGAGLELQPGGSIQFDHPGAVPTESVHVNGATDQPFMLLLGQRGGIE